jgi:hypothetical protein
MAKWFALTEETLKEVLTHLEKDATALLYSKVSRALPVQEATPAPQPQAPAPTDAGVTTPPSAN